MGKIIRILLLVALSLLFFLKSLPLLLNNQFYLSHDNLGYHFPSFVYFANSLAHGFGFPHLLLEWTGSDIGMTSISMGYFAPHRLMGYLLYLLLPLSPLATYKLSLVLGTLLNSLGWFLLWRAITGRWFGAAMGFLLFLGSGIAITILHQEQILATLAYVPWALYFFWLARENSKYLWLAAALSGAQLTLHYPQIHVLSGLFLILSLLILPGFRNYLRALPLKIRSEKASGLLLLLAITPLFFVLWNQNQYRSPVRANTSLQSLSFADYVDVNRQQDSSAKWPYLENLIAPQVEKGDDIMLFFIGSLGILLAAIGAFIVLRWERRFLFLLPLSGALAWASLGINGGLAQFLFLLRFPGIAYFRQWYHFTPLLLICLITLAVVAIDFLWTKAADRGYKRIAVGLFSLLGILAAIESQLYCQQYLARYHLLHTYEVPRYSRAEFLNLVNGRWLKEVLPIPFSISLLARTGGYEALKDCEVPEATHVWKIDSPHLPEWSCEWLKAQVTGTSNQVEFTPNSVRFLESGSYLLRLDPVFLDAPNLSGPLATLEAKAGEEIFFRKTIFFWLLWGQFLAIALGIVRLLWSKRRV